jgi:uncharacterized protein
MSPANKPAAGTLTGADMERLETLLWERAVPNGGMPLEMLDGFFSALVCGPRVVAPSEYTRMIWGDPPPVWESVQEASESFYLIQGYWNHVVDRVARDPEADPEAVAPAIMMPEELLADFDALIETGAMPESMSEETRAFPLASGWALGFFLGVELSEAEWDDWADHYEHIDEHLGDIQRLMEMPASDDDDDDDVEEALDSLLEPEDGLAEGDLDVDFGDVDEDEDEGDDEAVDPPDLIERLDIMFEIPHMLHAFDTLRRSEAIRAQGPAKREAGPGRNDPCPCGSGKKYKKCHGDPQRLH